MANFFSKLSLKGRLLGLVFSVTLVLGLAAMISQFYVRSLQKETQLHTFESFARQLGDAISAQFFERYGDVQAFAINPILQIGTPQKDMVDLLNTYSALYGIYDLIMVVDRNGRLVAVNSKGPDGKDLPVESLYEKSYRDAVWFRQAIEGKTTDDKERAFAGTFFEDAIVDPYTSEVFKENRLGSSFSTPLKSPTGNIIGVISNRAGSRWFEIAFREMSENLKQSGYSHVELALISKDGTLLYEVQKNLKGYDWDKLLKFNLAKAGLQAAVMSTHGKSGATIEPNRRSGTTQINGVATLNGPKFIESVGWSALVRNEEHDTFAALEAGERVFYICFLGAIGFALLLALTFANRVALNLGKVTTKLENGSSQVGTASTQLASASQDLSSSTQQQASALQETSSAVEEISAMVKKSAELADEAQQSAHSAQTNAERGNQIVVRMTDSIGAINKSTDEIAAQVQDSNNRISAIVEVIKEVGTKTKIINDIVFQTKLLSFNASVEAARAGEHGKGFAVVAEEIGNLAQMSGNAAKEINHLVDESLSTVSNIVQESKSRVETVLGGAKSTVAEGTRVANECGQVLKDIVHSSQSIAEMVTSIAQANRESAVGTEEISKAIAQLDQAIQTNAAAAEKCAHSSQMLSGQVHELRNASTDLTRVVAGKAGAQKFIWKDDYLLGVDEMDDQHKILINKINSLATSMNDSLQVRISKFREMAEYTAEHFSNEQRYMASIKYPDLQNHIQIHKTLLAKVGEFQDQLIEDKLDAAELTGFLNDWLLNHILGIDMKYARFAKNPIAKISFRGNKATGSAA